MSDGLDLKRELDRLTHDLQQACLEKVQAAEYGLAVLEEKQRVQEKYDDLEAAFEKEKFELSQATEVSCSFLEVLHYIVYTCYKLQLI